MEVVLQTSREVSIRGCFPFWYVEDNFTPYARNHFLV